MDFLFNPLYVAFGWFMKVLYDFMGNYGLTIIVFTVILRGLLIPLGVKQQKSTIKQQALAGEVAEIQRTYPNDKAKQSEMQMALYKKHGTSLGAGCLPSILQLIILIPIFQIFQRPLQFIMGVASENLDKIGQLLFNTMPTLFPAKDAVEAGTKAVASNMSVLNILSEHSATLSNVVDKGLMNANQLIDLSFLGMNLGETPRWIPAELFGDKWQTYVPLLIFPVLIVITMIIQMRIARVTMPNFKKRMEAKAREKLNPARAGQSPEDKTDSMMKTMNLVMPAVMLLTTFSMPAAMGLYWIIGNVMATLQSLLIYFLYTKKIEQHDRDPKKAIEISAVKP